MLLCHVAVNKSSDNWSMAMERQQSSRATLRASGSFNPAASHTMSRRPSTATPDKDKTGTSPEKDDKGPGRRPCAPARLPTVKDKRTTGPSAAHPDATGAAAAGGANTELAGDKAEDDEVMLVQTLVSSCVHHRMSSPDVHSSIACI